VTVYPFSAPAFSALIFDHFWTLTNQAIDY
jgi:hypothetical protein